MQSFEDFVKTLSREYPLNVIAQAYLKDWYDQQPIDGGVAYETQLRSIILDGSINSLATLDKFLDAIKPRLALDAFMLTQDTTQRNLLIFIGFYAGLVFCYQAKKSAYWVSFAHLTTVFPPLLKVISDDFSYSMAVSTYPMGTEVQPFVPIVMNQTTFFPLVSIMERLYPARHSNQSLPIYAPFFGFINDSLASSVEKLLQPVEEISKAPLAYPSVGLDNHAQFNQQTIAPSIENLNLVSLVSDKNTILTNLEKPNRLRFNTFRANKLLVLADNPFISLKSKQPYIDEALFEPYGHPLNAPQKPLQQIVNTEIYRPQSTLKVEQAAPVDMCADDTLAIGGKKPPMALSHSQSSSQEITEQNNQTSSKARKKLTSAEIRLSQQHQKNQAKEQKARQEALKKSIAEKAEKKRQQEIADALANPRIHAGLLNQSHSMLDIAKRHQQQTDSYSELEADLENPKLQALVTDSHPKLFISLPNGESLDEAYQKAKQNLIQINTAIQRYSEQYPQQDLQLSEKPQGIIAQAVNLIEITAKAGHPEAMLWLALRNFRGDPVFGIAQDTSIALEWVNMAAKLTDSRAEKLLSKLYYRGEGVTMDADLGNYWLELSAQHGHPEAKTISQQMAMAKLLKENRKADSNYMRLLLWGIAVLLTLVLVIIAFIKV